MALNFKRYLIRIIVGFAFEVFALTAQADITTGLLARYDFDGDVNDASGSGRNGVSTNITYVQGRIGQAGFFNNINSYVSVDGSLGWLPSGNADRTVAMWVKPSVASVNDNGNMVSWGEAGTALRFSTLMENNGELRMIGESVDRSSGFILPINIWTHVVLTYGSSNLLQFYVNGTLVNSFPGVGLTTAANTPLRIGINAQGRDDEYFGGALDDVRVYNRVLSSSDISQLYAQAITVPDAPTGLVATRGNTFVELNWSPPTNNGGSVITGYSVTGVPSSTCAATPPATSCTISGLTNGTTYTFTVKASNSKGDSAASTSVTTTPATVPGAPTGIVVIPSISSLVVSWSAPASDGGATITGYTVTGVPGGTCSATAPATTCTVYGLTNGTSYSVSVKATNAVGDSAASSGTSATPVSAPSAPTGLTATAGDRAVLLSWTASNSNGGSAITAYTVTGVPGGSCSTAATVTSCTIRGLTNGTSYLFTVKSTNAIGDSIASISASAIPQVFTQPSVGLPGGGTASVQISAPPGCVPSGVTINTSLPAGAPSGATAPLGALRFNASGTGCAAAMLTVRVDYPTGRLAGLRPFKYGPTGAGAPNVWFAHGTVSGDSVTYTVKDNDVGDSDLAVGYIFDPMAPLLEASVQSIPTLGQWALIIMSILTAVFGVSNLRRRPC